MRCIHENYSLDWIREGDDNAIEGGNDKNGVEEDEECERPEDIIPDLPENEAAREFLKNAPSKGFHLKCWL
jgi:hypothetical protein